MTKLKFTNHIEEICEKTSRKSNALARLAPYMGISKRLTLMNAFFKSQFNIPLIWMCSNRSLNEIDRLYERCLQIVYSDKTSNFSEMLEKDDSLFTIIIIFNSLQLKCSSYQNFLF